MLLYPLDGPPYEADSHPTPAAGFDPGHAPLPWGFRYLMCPPRHFEVAYEINPWMDRRVVVDRDRARSEWDGLVGVLRGAGARIDLMDPEPSLPDMVFTANAALVADGRAVVARFLNEERRGESAHDAEWFSGNGFRVEHLPGDLVQEGAGDALPFWVRDAASPVLLAGHGIRSQRGAVGALGRLLSVRVEPLELVDSRLYHLDLAFCPLGPGRAIVAPDAFTAAGRRRLEALVPEPLVLDIEEALTFCANSVVVGTTVVMPSCPPRIARSLEAWGYDVVVTPVDEFRKAGGAVRCLTLALDLLVGDTHARVAA